MKIKFLFLLLSLTIISCSSDDNTVTTPPPTGGNPDPVNPTLTDNVEVYNANLIHNNYTLAIENGQTQAYLINKEGEKVHEWTFSDNLGNDLEILPDGRLLGIFKDPNAQITFGGYGGIAKIINTNNSVAWEFPYSTQDYIIHHDVEMLPNGNVLMMVWERIEEMTAEQQGAIANGDVYPEKLIEVNPATDQIVWEWRSWDHIIHDGDNTLPNHGVISDHPELIDVNFFPANNGDIMHSNGFDYDENKDVIYLSVNFYNEVWVIDHSTTTAEAATHTGGNYNKGGDLLYRFGNPLAYDNTIGEVRSDRNHFPNLLENGVPGEGNMLLYVNGNSSNQSVIYELEMPQNFSLTPNADNEPNVVWSFEGVNLFANKISGAVRLSNGNTLICEGDYGFWEVTPQKQVVWKYNGDNTDYWRCYDYERNDPALDDYGL